MDRFDALIIGGGLLGCATAFHLASIGASVLLVEQGELNSGASGQNAGSLHFQMERRFLENGDALADQAAAIVALNRSAIEEWRTLEALLGCDLHVSMRGGLMVAETPEELLLLERKAALEARYGLDARIVDGAEARALCPSLSTTVIAASYLPEEGHADPRAVTPAFARAAAARGAILRPRTSLVGVEREAKGFTVELDSAEGREKIRAGSLLLAAGACTGNLAALVNVHLPVYPVALLMSATERTGREIAQLIQHVGHRLSMKRAHAGNILIGGGWPSRLASAAGGGFDLSRRATVIADSLVQNLRLAVRTVPLVRELNLIRSWTGVTAITADQLPLAGAVPQVPGLFVAAGGSAFTLGPTLARLLAGAMGGRPDDRLAFLSPARFNHLNSFMG
ncbi:FAD-binding oxidoreductase [Sphingosinicella sp. CPCC 101087]|uniref:NAD(P)/FAD-dependent oxidoreductase n=1 Tax=Sphingosinicella sp. CPCC 101087 TaxID=2497754 RepID=UPI00101E2204|nr:FAD-binding oxidoreductase [Sphingosinicella sp. CPCC 101087]